MEVFSDNYHIAEILQGNTKVFEILINRYKDYVFHIAYKILKDRQEAEEVAQDSFMKAYKNLESFSQESKFSNWLYKITYYSAISKARTKYRKTHLLAEDDREIEINEKELNLGLQDLKLSEQRKYLNMAMNRLPENIQIIMHLFYYKECSLKEIIEITDLKESNVKTLLHRGRKKLYLHLGELLKEEIKSII